MKSTRKGMAVGRGSGYKNIIRTDPVVHQNAGLGKKTYSTPTERKMQGNWRLQYQEMERKKENVESVDNLIKKAEQEKEEKVQKEAESYREKFQKKYEAKQKEVEMKRIEREDFTGEKKSKIKLLSEKIGEKLKQAGEDIKLAREKRELDEELKKVELLAEVGTEHEKEELVKDPDNINPEKLSDATLKELAVKYKASFIFGNPFEREYERRLQKREEIEEKIKQKKQEIEFQGLKFEKKLEKKREEFLKNLEKQK